MAESMGPGAAGSSSFCGNCGTALSSGAAFCPQCGAAVPPAAGVEGPGPESVPETPASYCGNCGTGLKAGAAFCPQCGTATTPAAATAAGAAVAGAGAAATTASPAAAVPPTPPPLEPTISGPATGVAPGAAYVTATGPAAAPRGGGALVPVIIAVVGLLLVAGTIVWSMRDEGGGSSSAPTEVFLESTASTGANPFTEPVDPEPTSTTLGPSTTVAVGATVAPVTAPTSGVAPPPGSPPYGGSGSDAVCDREKLVTFLTGNPDRARAWAGVLGVPVADIPTYVRSLTPTVLLYDTRVTNHGFANGQATTLQSVLQAGTAVLVDAKGNPVVRCRCGNPLTPPTPVARPVPRGTAWPGYRPEVAVAVNNGVTVTVVVNVSGGSPSSTPTTAPAGPGATGPTGTSAGTPGTAADIQGLLAVLGECAPGDGTVQILDIRKEADLPNTFSVRARVKGEEMIFVYNNATGSIQEGDRASAQLLDACGVKR